MKKLLKILLLGVIFMSHFGITQAQQAPGVVCYGLPGCETQAIGAADRTTADNNIIFGFLGKVISEGITYVAVIAVLSLIVSGILFLLSAGEEEKITKARKGIIWSLVGVFLSISAWSIINLLNTFKIN